jgi:hypothetical protein
VWAIDVVAGNRGAGTECDGLNATDGKRDVNAVGGKRGAVVTTASDVADKLITPIVISSFTLTKKPLK